MTVEQLLQTLPKQVTGPLLREEVAAQGRADAFRFVLEGRGDVACIEAKIQEIEEQINHPPDGLRGATTPGATPRVYKDAYLQGLRDALKILSGNHAV